MRLRNIPGAGEVIDNSPYCIKEPVELKGKWHDFLGNNNPIHIEVGMGKGRFLMDLARLHPEINYIGIERYQCASSCRTKNAGGRTAKCALFVH